MCERELGAKETWEDDEKEHESNFQNNKCRGSDKNGDWLEWLARRYGLSTLATTFLEENKRFHTDELVTQRNFHIFIPLAGIRIHGKLVEPTQIVLVLHELFMFLMRLLELSDALFFF